MLQVYVNNNPEDYSVTAGRISATFILHEMFIKNPIIGIGMGNYPFCGIWMNTDLFFLLYLFLMLLVMEE